MFLISSEQTTHNFIIISYVKRLSDGHNTMQGYGLRKSIKKKYIQCHSQSHQYPRLKWSLQKYV